MNSSVISWKWCSDSWTADVHEVRNWSNERQNLPVAKKWRRLFGLQVFSIVRETPSQVTENQHGGCAYVRGYLYEAKGVPMVRN